MIKYNETVMNEYMTRDSATFIEAYYNKELKKLNNLSEFKACCYVKFKCKCNNIYIKCFNNVLNTGFTCESCCKKNVNEKKKKTYLKNYGVENPNQSAEIKEKKKKTTLERYGVEYSLQSKDVREKGKKTNLERYGLEYTSQRKDVQEKVRKTTFERYGVEHILHNKDFKEQIRKTNLEKYGVECTLQNKEVKDKIKQTNLEKYGVENPSQNQAVKQKKKDTCIKNYGTEFPIQSKEIQDKIKFTNLEKYDVEYPTQNKNIREKVKTTNIERYGVEHAQQNKEIQEKTQHNAKKYKIYKMPSGSLRKVQGYEPFALNELIKSYTEEQIKTDRKDIPHIQYINNNNKNKYYFPDIYIPHEKYIIEVKSTWTYKCKMDSIKEKGEACKAEGYKYEIWVYTSKGVKEVHTF